MPHWTETIKYFEPFNPHKLHWPIHNRADCIFVPSGFVRHTYGHAASTLVYAGLLKGMSRDGTCITTNQFFFGMMGWLRLPINALPAAIQELQDLRFIKIVKPQHDFEFIQFLWHPCIKDSL
jgi:hypothetical protein